MSNEDILLYILRHGETEYNRKGITQGRGVNSDLNRTGLRQAGLFHKKYQDEAFKRIYTSTLKRTWQSVHPFIAKGLPWERLRGFDELDWGIFEGKEITKRVRERMYGVIYQWKTGNYDHHARNGESPACVSERAFEALQQVISRKESPVLICTHGRTLRILLARLFKDALSRMDEFEVPNLGLWIVRYAVAEQRFYLETEADTAHLQ